MSSSESVSGATPRVGGGLGQDRVPLLLEAGAVAHLGLHLGEAREHGFDILAADRLALGDHDLEHAARGAELACEVLDDDAHEPAAFGAVTAVAPPIDVIELVGEPEPAGLGHALGERGRQHLLGHAGARAAGRGVVSSPGACRVAVSDFATCCVSNCSNESATP